MTNVNVLLDKINRLELEGREILEGRSEDEIRAQYNGIGADWMGDALRNVVTDMFGVFEAAALVHDCEYAWSQDRSQAKWKAVNLAFLRNCKKLIADSCRWWQILMYYALNKCARLMFNAVSGFGGWMAWCQAARKK